MSAKSESRSELLVSSLLRAVPSGISTFIAPVTMVAESLGSTPEQIVAVLGSEGRATVGPWTIELNLETQRIAFSGPVPVTVPSRPLRPIPPAPARAAAPTPPKAAEVNHVEIAAKAQRLQAAAEAKGEFLTTAEAVAHVYQELRIPLF